MFDGFDYFFYQVKNDIKRLCTIYGHTIPEDDLYVGKIIKKGEVIATLADSGKFKTNIYLHLQISLGWISKAISCDRLNWEIIGSPNMLTLLDPLMIIDWPYGISGHRMCEELEYTVRKSSHFLKRK